MKLYAKLMLSFGLLSLVALSFISFVAIDNSTKVLTRTIGAGLQHICQSAAVAIDSYLNAKINELQLMTQTKVIRELDVALINDYFSRVKDNTKDYKEIILVSVRTGAKIVFTGAIEKTSQSPPRFTPYSFKLA